MMWRQLVASELDSTQSTATKHFLLCSSPLLLTISVKQGTRGEQVGSVAGKEGRLLSEQPRFPAGIGGLARHFHGSCGLP
jgi:hypothetical protein